MNIARSLNCPICFVQFSTFINTKKFCSNECALKNKKKTIIEWVRKNKIKNRIYKIIICKICGTEFSTYNKIKKYCSNECALKNKKKTIIEWVKKNKIEKRIYRTLNCPICATQFTTYNKGRKFCTTACMLINKKRFITEYYKKPEQKQKQAERLKVRWQEKYKNPEFRKIVSDSQKAQRKKDPDKTKARDKELYWKRKNNPITYERDKKKKNSWLKKKKKRRSLLQNKSIFISKFNSISKKRGNF